MEKLENGTEVLIFKDPNSMIDSDYTFGTIIDCVVETDDDYWNLRTYKVMDIDGNEQICSWESIIEPEEYKAYLYSMQQYYDKEIEELVECRAKVFEKMGRLENETKTLRMIKAIENK